LFILTITYRNINESTTTLLIPLEMVRCSIVQQVAAMSSKHLA